MLFKVIALAAALGLASAQVANQQVAVPASGKVVFTSPGYPAQYANSLTYTYRVTGGQPGKGFQFDAEAFATEAGTYDTLRFSERNAAGVSIAIGSAYSGTNGPKKLVSSTNDVLVTFKTDSSVVAAGFRIAVSTPICASGESLCPGSDSKCITSAQYCDGVSDCEDGSDENKYCRTECGVAAVQPDLSAGAQLLAALSRPAVKTSDRIVGGTIANAHSWPWQVAMLTSSNQQICGGTLINNEWVLTAAHCCVASSATPSSYRVQVGAHNLANSNSPSAEPHNDILTLSKLIVHPGYVSRPAPHNDFCLLKLAAPIQFNEHIEPACLPNGDGSHEAPGTKCWVTGWGSTRQNRGSFADFIADVKQVEAGKLPKPASHVERAASRATPALYQVGVSITTAAVCQAAYPGNITPQMICASSPGRDSCQGDSGGPFVCQGEDGSFKLVGVVSWGIGCARPGYPGVYARTSTALDWIRGEIYA